MRLVLALCAAAMLAACASTQLVDKARTLCTARCFYVGSPKFALMCVPGACECYCLGGVVRDRK